MEINSNLFSRCCNMLVFCLPSPSSCKDAIIHVMVHRFECRMELHWHKITSEIPFRFFLFLLVLQPKVKKHLRGSKQALSSSKKTNPSDAQNKKSHKIWVNLGSFGQKIPLRPGNSENDWGNPWPVCSWKCLTARRPAAWCWDDHIFWNRNFFADFGCASHNSPTVYKLNFFFGVAFFLGGKLIHGTILDSWMIVGCLAAFPFGTPILPCF